MKKIFTAFEFHSDEKFYPAEYCYQGDEQTGWSIYRNGQLFLELGQGYRLLKSLYCGICSTDIARAKLPFALPQITGHELVALDHNKPVLVEINASHKARGVDCKHCPYCVNNMDIHCPERLTLGIDRLPGGFSPYVLAPVNSIIPLPQSLNPLMASITEPFAAALHAVASVGIQNHWRVAVVGPRRLGALLLLALALYRKQHALEISISAIIRNPELKTFCIQAGADEVIESSEIDNQRYDLVFDTSGSSSGFKLALSVCDKILHVKSTHGLPVEGLSKLTEMVIDELSLESINARSLNSLQEKIEKQKINNILIDEAIPGDVIERIQKCCPELQIIRTNIQELKNKSANILLPDNAFKKFDAVCVLSLDLINRVIRNQENESLLRAGGVIFYYQAQNTENPSLLQQVLFDRNVSIQTSRCGSFSQALELMLANKKLFEDFAKKFITHTGSVEEINSLFDIAKNNKQCIKAVVKHMNKPWD